MNKKRQNKIALITVLLSMLLSLHAMAQQQEASVQIPVVVSTPMKEKNQIELTGEQETQKKQVKGTGDIAFTLTFNEPGTYIYTLRKLPGKHPEDVKYDRSEYTVYVYVSYENGQLSTQLSAAKTGSKDKTAVLEFRDTWTLSGYKKYVEALKEKAAETEEDPENERRLSTDTSGDSLAKPGDSAPATGDSTPLLPYIALLVAALGTVMVCIERRGKHVE